jgi:hypothetical protein
MLPDDFIHWIAIRAAFVALLVTGLALVVRWIMRKARTPEIKLPWE